MALLYYARRLYSLDTLDTRFATPAKTPPSTSYTQIDPTKPSSSEDSGAKRRDNGTKATTQAEGVSPPLWRTPEFYFYYFIFVVCVPLMFKAVYDVSNRE